MAGNVWVLAEQWRGQLSDVTFELLVLGRELADRVGGPLQAVLLGHQVTDLAGKLGAADAVLHVDHALAGRAQPGGVLPGRWRP